MKNNIRNFIVIVAVFLSACQATTSDTPSETVMVSAPDTEVTTIARDESLYVMPEQVYGEVTTKREETSLCEEQFNEIEIKLFSEMPNFEVGGSEIASAVANLNYYGFDCTKEELVKYMPVELEANSNGKWDSPNLYYLGNPFDIKSYCYMEDPKDRSWYGCNANVMKITIENYFVAQNVENYEVIDMSGSDFEDLCQEVINGTPVMVWGTYFFEDLQYSDTLQLSDGTDINWVSNRQIFNFVGMDHFGYAMTFIDTAGPIYIDKETAVDIYNKMGQQAIVIHKKD